MFIIVWKFQGLFTPFWFVLVCFDLSDKLLEKEKK